MIGDYDFSDTDCPDECEPGCCTCDETFPPWWLIGLAVAFFVVAGVLL